MPEFSVVVTDQVFSEVEVERAADQPAGVPNLLGTPHSAFSSQEAIRESQLKALCGEPLDSPCL